MKLICGLGNVGKKYEFTRHNVGFMCVDYFCKKNKLMFKYNKNLKCYITYKIINNEKCIIIKPATFMNLSGEAIDLCCSYYKIDKKDILVISDDLDLPCGFLRLRNKGSSGGHNGIKSIIQYLGSEDFLRLKIGISRDKNILVNDYVLSRFSKEDIVLLYNIFENTNNLLDDFINGLDYLRLGTRYNDSKK